MSKNPVVDSFASNYSQLLSALARIGGNCDAERLSGKPDDPRFDYCSVRTWSLAELFARTGVKPAAELKQCPATPQLSTPRRPHRVSSQLFELAGSLDSLLVSRHLLADGALAAAPAPDADPAALKSQMTPASYAAGLAIVGRLEESLRAEPCEGPRARWLPAAAIAEVIALVRGPDTAKR